jgi:hypothetical protein
MPRLLNVQRKRTIMKKRQHVVFSVYLYATAWQNVVCWSVSIHREHVRLTKIRTDAQNHSVRRRSMVTSHLRHCLQTATSARRRLFGDRVCQQNTRNRVQSTNIGAKGPKICIIFTVKSSRFQRVFYVRSVKRESIPGDHILVIEAEIAYSGYFWVNLTMYFVWNLFRQYLNLAGQIL